MIAWRSGTVMYLTSSVEAIMIALRGSAFE